MAINRFLQSSVQSGLPKFDAVWDGISAVGSMEPISSITLSGNQSSIEFNNIPSTYTNLQLRFMTRNTDGAGGSTVSYGVTGFLVFNNDTTSNYSAGHWIQGEGTVASSGIFGASQSSAFIPDLGGTYSTAGSGIFVIGVIDILDYTNTNKGKTVKALLGQDRNGYGRVQLASIAWMSNNAITSIRIGSNGANFTTNSSFSLYGIK